MVGERANYEYAKNLASRQPTFHVTGIYLGNALKGALQRYSTVAGQPNNLTLIENVDATHLEAVLTVQSEYDAIIFNNPFVFTGTTAETEKSTLQLIKSFIGSARGQLAQDGRILINTTHELIKPAEEKGVYLKIRQYLTRNGAVPDGDTRLGNTPYYAAYTPRIDMANGIDVPMSFYGDNPTNARFLRTFVTSKTAPFFRDVP